MTRYLLVATAAVLLLSPDGTAQRRRGPDVARMLERFDTDKDGKLTRKEVGGRMWRRLSAADSDKDGIVTRKELEAMAKARSRRGGRGRGGSSDAAWKFLAEKYDADKDGKIDKTEYDRDQKTFERLDTNGDGALTKDDWQNKGDRRNRSGSVRTKRPTAPKAGEQAPDFELTHVEDKGVKIKLSEFTGDKPVALIFGSCT